MNHLDVQYIHTKTFIPEKAQLQTWVDSALREYENDAEIVIRIVDEKESELLNDQYRHKTGPTNILSFPFTAPDGIELNLLGDLVICAPVLKTEALQQQKNIEAHWAHIVIHGILHLLGYNHINDEDAEEMEMKEVQILKKMHINNPYQEVVSDERRTAR